MGVGANAADEAHKDTPDPEAWAIVDGKLYFTHNQYWVQVWRENAAEHIRQGERDWEAVKNLPAPEIVGPPCAASPPTTLLALRGGGHWVNVGGQVARDEAGNVVGKGDMRAQSAGGAAVKDIIFAISYVTEPTEFDKYADLRLRYFGPPLSNNFTKTVAVPQLANPDFLVQVEAFAKTQ
jgi:2-iminobutanoate/2-iminopropanoate deaminase